MGSIAVDNPDVVCDWFPDYPESERTRKVAATARTPASTGC